MKGGMCALAAMAIVGMMWFTGAAQGAAREMPQKALDVPLQRPTGPRTPVAAPQGPAPQNVHMVPGGPIVHTLVWDRLPGISGYTVAFNNAATKGTWVLATPQPLLAESFDDKNFPQAGTRYLVTALYPDGRQGSTEYVYPNPPQMQVPTGFAVQQVGPGKVRLSWQPVALAKGYRVYGSGQPQDGTYVPATELVLSGMPDGTYSWQLTADYGGAWQGAGMPVAGITLASAASGNYLVTITGLRAIAASSDDALSRDGMGDEVYVKTFIRNYDRRNNGVLTFWAGGTMTYGDVTSFGTQRIQAGGMSALGGIRDGDPIPIGGDPTDRIGNPSDTAFPLRVWQGPLTNGVDALVISASIWEEDGIQAENALWSQQMNNITATLFSRPEIQNQISSGKFAPIVFGTSASGQITLPDPLVLMLAGATMGWSLTVQGAVNVFRGGHDRPIGLIPTNAANVSMVLPNEVVVLTREIVEAALAPILPGTPPIGPPFWPRFPKPGVMMIPFRDGPTFNVFGEQRAANYEMYLKVERMP